MIELLKASLFLAAAIDLQALQAESLMECAAIEERLLESQRAFAKINSALTVEAFGEWREKIEHNLHVADQAIGKARKTLCTDEDLAQSIEEIDDYLEYIEPMVERLKWEHFNG